MTWHSAIVTADRLAAEITKIRNHGGTLVSATHEGDRVRLTWTTSDHAHLMGRSA